MSDAYHRCLESAAQQSAQPHLSSAHLVPIFFFIEPFFCYWVIFLLLSLFLLSHLAEQSRAICAISPVFSSSCPNLNSRREKFWNSQSESNPWDTSWVTRKYFEHLATLSQTDCACFRTISYEHVAHKGGHHQKSEGGNGEDCILCTDIFHS